MGKFIMKDALSLNVAYMEFYNRNWWDFACWSNVVSLLSGVERLTIQNMWIWFEFMQMEKSMHDNDKEHKRKPELERDGESVDSQLEFHGQLREIGMIFSGLMYFF
ncbi:hypothetical protein ACH5RR_028996 [Cinchona calisaya]|uniref:Uncharacterized protein n=1 Tax=Cinchona calisaya TaxID=153742 RepID=A0ABD2YTZ9_9GENT